MEYFRELRTTLEIVDPLTIVNYDETNFSDQPSKVKVICRRGSKHCDRIIDSSKSSVRVMMLACLHTLKKACRRILTDWKFKRKGPFH